MAQDPGVNFLPLGWEAPASAEATIRLDSTPWPKAAGLPGSSYFWLFLLRRGAVVGGKVEVAQWNNWGGEERDCFLRNAGLSGRVRAARWALQPCQNPWGGGQCCRGGKGAQGSGLTRLLVLDPMRLSKADLGREEGKEV